MPPLKFFVIFFSGFAPSRDRNPRLGCHVPRAEGHTSVDIDMDDPQG